MPETESNHRRSVLAADDGHHIHVQVWEPAGDASATIQVLHGLGEHADRYARFATAATRRGYAVCAHDHRGHGPATTHIGHFADSNGWTAVIDDARAVNGFAGESFPDRPLILLGHSMGSFIAQAYAMRYGNELAGLILSASTWSSRTRLGMAFALAKIESWRLGPRSNSVLLDKLGFGDFNKAFAPARTEYDWLSRDECEVDRYIADSLCGGPFSTRLWLDFLSGLLGINRDRALSRIPSTLPILITGGARDPVGGDKGMSRLLQHYTRAGHDQPETLIYPGGRHEMLNEVNRDEVTRDWLDWMDATTGSQRSG